MPRDRGIREKDMPKRIGSFMKIRTRLAGAIAAIAIGAAPSCSSIDCNTEDESYFLLKSVPLPPGAVIPGDTGPVSGRPTYTIESTGTFNLSHMVEEKVGRLGAEVSPLDPKAAGERGLEPYKGVLVHSVDRNGPASRAGIIPGDVILTFGGQEASSPNRMAFLVESQPPGSTVEVEFARKDQRSIVSLQLGEETRSVSGKGFQMNLPVLNDRRRTGLKLAELTDAVRAIVAPGVAEKGVFVMTVLPGSPAFFADLRVRDIIVEANGRNVPTLGEWAAVIGDVPVGTTVPLRVYREGLPVDGPPALKVVEDAERSGGFNLLGIVKYKRKPSSRSFGLLWGLIFHAESCYAVERHGYEQRNVRKRGWGAVLDLIEAKRTPKEKELTLLWFFPIRIGDD